MNPGRPDAIVVGAGIVGAACARALASGGMSVVVLESAFAASGATAAAMGHLVVMDDSEAQFALTSYSRRLWIELASTLPANCEDDPCGTLWVAADDEEMAHVAAKKLHYEERGVATEILSGTDVARIEPHLRPGLAGGLRVPGDRVVYPPNAARWLLGEAIRMGATLLECRAVLKIGPRSVETADGRLEADIVVNAAGADAPRLTPGLPIEPRKGHLVITDRAPGFCHNQIVELGYLKSAHTMEASSVAFNVQPRATGQLLVGSSREFVGRDPSINRPLLARMLKRAFEFMPDLRTLPALRTWVGFRPATPDKLPLIGRWEEVDGLFIAAGHEGLGITTALGTAGLLADLVMGRSPAIDPRPFAPMRGTGERSVAAHA